jgi:hypothetical protein
MCEFPESNKKTNQERGILLDTNLEHFSLARCVKIHIREYAFDAIIFQVEYFLGDTSKMKVSGFHENSRDKN